MSDRRWAVAVVIALAAVLTMGSVQAADDMKYPDWRGQWARFAVPGLPGVVELGEPGACGAGGRLVPGAGPGIGATGVGRAAAPPSRPPPFT